MLYWRQRMACHGPLLSAAVINGRLVSRNRDIRSARMTQCWSRIMNFFVSRSDWLLTRRWTLFSYLWLHVAALWMGSIISTETMWSWLNCRCICCGSIGKRVDLPHKERYPFFVTLHHLRLIDQCISSGNGKIYWLITTYQCLLRITVCLFRIWGV